MKIFRASYSILNFWENGDYDSAIRAYFKLPYEPTEPMKIGKAYHEKWGEYIVRHKKLPKELGGVQLIDPVSELKLETKLNKWLSLVGVIDCIDSGTIYEFKSGKTGGRSHQAGCYGLLCKKHSIEAKQCQIRHFNQHTNKLKVDIYYLTDKFLKDTSDWIESLSSDMRHYIIENNLYAQYGREETK